MDLVLHSPVRVKGGIVTLGYILLLPWNSSNESRLHNSSIQCLSLVPKTFAGWEMACLLLLLGSWQHQSNLKISWYDNYKSKWTILSRWLSQLRIVSIVQFCRCRHSAQWLLLQQLSALICKKLLENLKQSCYLHEQESSALSSCRALIQYSLLVRDITIMRHHTKIL